MFFFLERVSTYDVWFERLGMPSNYHDEAGPSFSRLSYEYEWRNECRALSFTANPKKFLNADTFCFVEPWACGPPLSVGSIGWIYQVKVNVCSSKDGASPISRSCSGAKTKRLLPTVLDLRPGIIIRLRHQSVFGIGGDWTPDLLYKHQRLYQLS